MRPSSLCALAAILLLGAGTVAAQTAPQKVTPVPRVTGPVPATADSRPFMAAADAQTSLNLPAYGYVEEEFFISGMANAYDWDSSGAVTVRTADAPYTTRILLRRPIDPARFSGTVWVDMLNPARGYDFAENWGTTNYYIMDHGDASIGVTIFPAAIRGLKKFDPKRHGTISMANPATPLQACPQGGKVIHVDPVLNPTDDYYSKFPKANLILITHAHVDHLDSKAIEKLSTDKTVVIACPGCSSTLPKAHILANGETGTFAEFKIEAVPAYNIVNKRPDGVAFHPKGDGDGFIITFGDKRIYIAGDTENIPEMKSFGRIDVAFLPMNLPYTMTPEMVADAVRSIHPAILYPYHYSTTNPLALVDLLQKEKSIEVRIRDLR
jgi:L-ascorbate metabolism protein UlaG (beta-lactamase superfamily)